MIEIERVNPFVSSVLDAIDSPSQIEIAAERLHEAETRTGVVAHYSTDVFFPEINDNEWCTKEFHDFMNATHLVIAGGDLMNMVDSSALTADAKRSRGVLGGQLWQTGQMQNGSLVRQAAEIRHGCKRNGHGNTLISMIAVTCRQ